MMENRGTRHPHLIFFIILLTGVLLYLPSLWLGFLLDDYLFIGAGLGGFPMLYSSYALLLHVGFTQHSHNLFLDVSVEQGLPALMILVWMWFLFAVAAWRGLVRSDAHPGEGILGAAAMALVVLLLHGLVDPFHVLLVLAPGGQQSPDQGRVAADQDEEVAELVEGASREQHGRLEPLHLDDVLVVHASKYGCCAPAWQERNIERR